jgi:hypothetical protein
MAAVAPRTLLHVLQLVGVLAQLRTPCTSCCARRLPASMRSRVDETMDRW